MYDFFFSSIFPLMKIAVMIIIVCIVCFVFSVAGWRQTLLIIILSVSGFWVQ